MLIIRKPEESDWPEMLAMGIEFAASNPHNVGFSPDAFRGLFDHAMTGDHLAFWIAQSNGVAAGMMGAITYPLFFNPAMKIAQELFWWVKPEHRATQAGKALLASFEGWAEKSGAHRLMLLAQENDRIPAIDRLYKTMGYAPIERVYYKELAPWQ